MGVGVFAVQAVPISASTPPKKRIGVIGFGTFGQFIAPRLGSGNGAASVQETVLCGLEWLSGGLSWIAWKRSEAKKLAAENDVFATSRENYSQVASHCNVPGPRPSMALVHHLRLPEIRTWCDSLDMLLDQNLDVLIISAFWPHAMDLHHIPR